jgi:hypothetical protein
MVFAMSIQCIGQRGFFEEDLKSMLPKKPVKFRTPLVRNNLNDTSIISNNAVYVNIFEDWRIKNYKYCDTTYSYNPLCGLN